MNLLDLLIIIIIAAEAVRGAQLGIVRSFLSLSGFWLGLLLGAILAPFALRFVAGQNSKLVFMLVITFGLAFIGGLVGQSLARHLKKLTERLKLTRVDSVLGAGFSAITGLLIVWFFASAFGSVPFREFNRQLKASSIIRVLDEELPPAPTVLARLNRLVGPYGFPEVFVGHEPAPAEPVDPATAAEIAQALEAAAASTVRIEGVGCGGTVNGSGFVAAPGLIITNAHVVAGVNRPVSIDGNGRHRSPAIYFDPDLDIAILRAEGLAGSPLPISSELSARGTKAVVLGHPEGGPLRAVPAGLSQQFEARGRDIYNQDIITRTVYELQTVVESGNSGGPVVRPDGTVIGLIFARSQTNDHIGYALTSPDIIKSLERASDAREVSTGQCSN